eukprot:s710_g4.t1
MDEWMTGWLAGWTDGRTDGWMDDNRSLQECGIVGGEHDIVLVPGLSHRATGVAPICARRGLNMVPSGPSLPWKPSKHSRIRHEERHASSFGRAREEPQKGGGQGGELSHDQRLRAVVLSGVMIVQLDLPISEHHLPGPVVAPKSPWDGVTTATLFKRLNPVVQDMLAQTPQMRKDWEKSMNTAMLESKKKSIPEQQELRNTLDTRLRADDPIRG